MKGGKVMITILGEHISLIRPSLDYQCRIYKNEHPKAKYDRKPKTNKENCGRVIAICVKLIKGGIRSMPTPATHLQVCEQMVNDFNSVIQTGWQLDNGNYVWQ